MLGRIIAPYGIQGWLKVRPFGDDPAEWRRMPQWWLAEKAETPEKDWQPHTLSGCRARNKELLVSFDGIVDRTAAEQLCGFYIAAPREALPAPGEDEYYWADLIGLDVLDEEGQSLGTVSGLISTGAHDVLKVQDNSGEAPRERLIPFVAAHVRQVDLADRVIRTGWNRDW